MPELNVADWRELEPISLSPILAAALDVYSEDGYHGATVRTIAARAGITVPLLYYHHKNKQGLLIDLVREAYAQLEHRIELARADAGDDPVLGFSNIIEAIVIHSAGYLEFTEINSELRYVEESERSPLLEVRRRTEAQIVEAIEQGIKAGAFSVDEPRGVARALAGMCNAVATWYRLDGPKAPQQIAAEYVEHSLRMVGYQPAGGNGVPAKTKAKRTVKRAHA